MRDTVQPGTEIDAEEWRLFREEVERRKGGVRGHLRTELENALRAYRQGGEATPAEVDERLKRIEAAVGVEATDGGTDSREPTQHTHTPEEVPDEKPHPKASSQDKVAWLAEQYRCEYGNDGEVNRFVKGLASDIVEDAYSFNDDVVDRYVDRMISYFGMVQRPNSTQSYVTQERHDELVEQQREQELDEARNRSEDLEQ